MSEYGAMLAAKKRASEDPPVSMFEAGWVARGKYQEEQAAAKDAMDDAIHIAVEHGRRTICGAPAHTRRTVSPLDPRPDGAEGCWTCLLIAGELAPRDPW